MKNGHDLCFPRSYEKVTLQSGTIRHGKRLPTTAEQINEGKDIQRNMHGLKRATVAAGVNSKAET